MIALSNASRGSHKVGATVPLPCLTTVMSLSLLGSVWAQALVWLPQSRFDLLHASNTAFDMQRTTNSCASSRSSSPSP